MKNTCSCTKQPNHKTMPYKEENFKKHFTKYPLAENQILKPFYIQLAVKASREAAPSLIIPSMTLNRSQGAWILVALTSEK